MKIIEIFKSLQGEGPKIGSPSLFLRLCGCNMKCRFNCNSSKDIEKLETEWNTEIEAVNNGAELKDLRLLNSGCDSYPAILPDIYNKIAKDYTDEKIIGLGIGNYAKKSDLNNHTSNVNIHITADERTKWNAAERNAKDYADNNFIKDENGVITKAKLAQEVLTYIDDVSTLTTNGNWTYVKMKNGTVIAWGSFTQTATLKNGLNTDLTISSTYPSGIFSQVPTCIPNLYINGGAILQYNKSAGTKTKTPELGVCFFGGSDVEVTIYSDYIVFGKWK